MLHSIEYFSIFLCLNKYSSIFLFHLINFFLFSFSTDLQFSFSFIWNNQTLLSYIRHISYSISLFISDLRSGYPLSFCPFYLLLVFSATSYYFVSHILTWSPFIILPIFEMASFIILTTYRTIYSSTRLRCIVYTVFEIQFCLLLRVSWILNFFIYSSSFHTFLYFMCILYQTSFP